MIPVHTASWEGTSEESCQGISYCFPCWAAEALHMEETDDGSFLGSPKGMC